DKGDQPSTKDDVREGKKVVEQGGHGGCSFKEVVSTKEVWRGKEGRVVEVSGVASASHAGVGEEG
ncbi:hypothetical protein A2U01_0083539, partial [Trifolium medium]|nr:hypothetical protein [Trifolium medium]